jgi:hypothetical protein
MMPRFDFTKEADERRQLAEKALTLHSSMA